MFDIFYSLREWLCYANCLSHIYLCIYQNSEGDFKFILALNFNFSSSLTWFHCLINETDSPFNLTLLIICQSNANFKTEWVIQNELLPLKLGKSSIRMGFTWQGSDHFFSCNLRYQIYSIKFQERENVLTEFN